MLRLRGSIDIQYTLAEMGAARLWDLLNTEPYVNSLPEKLAQRSNVSLQRTGSAVERSDIVVVLVVAAPTA